MYLHEQSARERRPRACPVRQRARCDLDCSRHRRVRGNHQAVDAARCRRAEVGDLRRSEVDLEAGTITLAPARTKNKREHVIPLSPAAIEILAAQPHRFNVDGSPRDLIFGCSVGFMEWSRAKADLDARITAAGKPFEWRVHDFRRSLSTSLHERFGVQPNVVEVILGHVGGHKGGVAGVYNKALYLPERRRALTRWAEHLDSVVTGKPVSATIVNLR